MGQGILECVGKHFMDIPLLTWLSIIPDIAVAIYCGLQTLAATLVVCFETPVFLTGSQR
jgi:hypothetical protein